MSSVPCVSACTGDGFCTSGDCVWVWGPPAASSERCGVNGRWKLHTPVWLHCWTCVFHLEMLESPYSTRRLAGPGHKHVQNTDTKRTTGIYPPLSEDTSPFPLVLWGLISQVKWLLLMNLRGHKGPQFFHREVNYVYRDINLVLNNLMFFIIYIQCLYFCYVFRASPIAIPLCM